MLSLTEQDSDKFPTEPVTMRFSAQPQKYGHCFRFKSDGFNHGTLRSDGGHETKTEPVVELTNSTKRDIHVTLTFSLVTVHDDTKKHLNAIIYKGKKGTAIQTLSPQQIVLKPGKNEHRIRNVLIHQAEIKKFQKSLLKRILCKGLLKEENIEMSTITNVTKDNNNNNNNNNDDDDDQVNPIEGVYSFMGSQLEEEEENKYNDCKGKENTLSDDRRKCLNEMAKKLSSCVSLKQCRLKVEAVPKDNDFTIQSITSNVIYDGKTNEGSIYKLDDVSITSGSVAGGDVMWLESGKLNACDVLVNFVETNEEGINVWKAEGQSVKINKNYLVKLKTPKYHDQNITHDVEVDVFISRLTDPDHVSEKKKFTYKPKRSCDPQGVEKLANKRISSEDLDFDLGSIPKKPKLQLPPNDIQLPPNNIQLPPNNIQLPPKNIQLPPNNIQLPPNNIQLPPSNIQLPPNNIQLPPNNIQLPPNNIQLPSNNIQQTTPESLATSAHELTLFVDDKTEQSLPSLGNLDSNFIITSADLVQLTENSVTNTVHAMPDTNACSYQFVIPKFLFVQSEQGYWDPNIVGNCASHHITEILDEGFCNSQPPNVQANEVVGGTFGCGFPGIEINTVQSNEISNNCFGESINGIKKDVMLSTNDNGDMETPVGSIEEDDNVSIDSSLNDYFDIQNESVNWKLPDWGFSRFC